MSISIKFTSVIMYHSVGELPFAVKEKEFIRQIEYFKRIGISSLTSIETSRKNVILTFDDGYVDNYEVLFPIINKYKIQVTIFPVTECLGRKNSFGRSSLFHALTKEMIKEMSESGLVEFGSHTHNHVELNKLSENEIEYEIQKSTDILETIMDKKVESFSFPFSQYEPRAIKYLEKNNISYAVNGRQGYIMKGYNPLSIPRWGIGAKTNMLSVKLKVNGIYLLRSSNG